jgi:hypothetical protein
MRQFVHRFATEQMIGSFEDLERLHIGITPKQRSNITARTARLKDPVAFADAWAGKFVADKYGEATTHWSKLMARIERGVGNPCPLLLIGLPARIVKFDVDPVVEAVDPDEDGFQP